MPATRTAQQAERVGPDVVTSPAVAQRERPIANALAVFTLRAFGLFFGRWLNCYGEHVRKFCVRWWVVNPRERYERETEALTGEQGISVRFRKEATDEDVRYFIRAWFLNLDTGQLTIQ